MCPYASYPLEGMKYGLHADGLGTYIQVFVSLVQLLHRMAGNYAPTGFGVGFSSGNPLENEST